MKFLPALIQTIKRLFMSINHIPKPGNKYFPEIVLGFDSAGGFPQMQGRDINIKTDHMTPGWYNIVIFHFSFPRVLVVASRPLLAPMASGLFFRAASKRGPRGALASAPS